MSDVMNETNGSETIKRVEVMEGRFETYGLIDKSGYPLGEWDNEPDLVEWVHEGLNCVIRRNGLGALCGYVGVGKDHKFFKDDYNEHGDLPAHYGLTFSNHFDDESLWFFGMDASHSGDLSPVMMRYGAEFGSYKNISFMINEVEQLAKALAEI